MESKKLWVLSLIPLMMLAFMPMPAHAVSNTYYIEVWCNNDYNPSVSTSAQFTFLGHTASVTCPAGRGDASRANEISFASARVGQFSAISQAGNVVHNQKGIFTPGSCYEEGGTYDSSDQAYGYWEIWTTACVEI